MGGGEDRIPGQEKIPVVLDLTEVKSLFSVTKNLKHKAILDDDVFFGIKSERTASLKLTDIDSKRMMVRVSQAREARIVTPFCPNGLEHLDNTGTTIAPGSGC